MTTRKDAITAKDALLRRICKALGETPEQLCKNLGADYKDFEPLLDLRHTRPEIDRDAVWWQLTQYVDHRLALIMAVRADLNSALQRDRQKRAIRVAAMAMREGKGSPRGRRRKTDDGDTNV